MIRYLIKNNFKIMFRNKWILGMIIFGPVITIAILSSAFSDLMKKYDGVDEFQAGYRAEEDSVFAQWMDVVKETGAENGIKFSEYPEGKPEDVIKHNNLAGFVEFGKDGYTLFKSADYEMEGITLEYFLNCMTGEFEKSAMQSVIPIKEEQKVNLPVRKLEYLPAVDATDYYGMIYIVYFTWIGLVSAANVLSSEKKYGISRKFQVTAVPGVKMYLSKWIPAVMVVSAGIAVTVALTVLLYGIHWGNIFVSAGLILLTIMAATAYGLMLYYIFQNMVLTIIVLFISTFVMGFFGGSFETYMYSAWPESVKSLSPIYHTNRALVELSSMGHSNYTVSSIVYLSAILVISTVVSILFDKIRRGGKA